MFLSSCLELSFGAWTPIAKSGAETTIDFNEWRTFVQKNLETHFKKQPEIKKMMIRVETFLSVMNFRL